MDACVGMRDTHGSADHIADGNADHVADGNAAGSGGNC
jgi:hypothetical protein